MSGVQGFTGKDTTGAAVAWGNITGSISAQSDLQSALNARVPTSRILTINGVALDLSADRSWTIGGGVARGAITGTLSAQTDLQTALNAKQDTLVSGTSIKTVNGTTLLGSGNLAVGDMLLGTAQTVSAAKTFNDSTLLMRNVANTFSSRFTNTNTAARVYTLPDSDQTLVGRTTTDTLTNKTLTSPVINVGSDANFDMYYRNGSGVFTRLPNGATGQVLNANTGAAPSRGTTAGPTSTAIMPMPVGPFSGGTNRDFNTNTTLYVGLVTIPQTISVTKLSFYCNSIGVAGVGSIAFYDLTGARILTATTSGNITVGINTITISAVTLPAGTYYMGFNSGGQHDCITWALDFTFGYQFDIRSVAPRAVGITSTTAGTTPSSITIGSLSDTSLNTLPVVRLAA